jgi:hypothetical protein
LRRRGCCDRGSRKERMWLRNDREPRDASFVHLQNRCGRGAIAAALFGIFLDRGGSCRMRLQAEVPTRYTSKEDDAAWIALHAAELLGVADTARLDR